MAASFRHLPSTLSRSIALRMQSSKFVIVSRNNLHHLPAAFVAGTNANTINTTVTANFKPIGMICASLLERPLKLVCVQQTRHGHKPALTFDYIRERIMLVLRLYDKVDPDKLTLDSHFYNDLGLDSLDHVEVIMSIEDEFGFEIPDVDAERLNTPRDILNYISVKEEIYPELEHHGDGGDHHAHH